MLGALALCLRSGQQAVGDVVLEDVGDVGDRLLRRSFVTNARRRGVPESVVMKLSGHKTRSVFDRYNVVSEDDLKNAVRQIESGSAAELTASFGHDLDTVSPEREPDWW